MRKIRIHLHSLVIEAHLRDTSIADAIYNALPFEAHAEFMNDEIVIASPVYSPMEDGASSEVMPGEIAARHADQNIVIGCEQRPDTYSSEVCLAGAANVFAAVTTDMPQLSGLPERFIVRIEAC